jgi:MFS family permease
MTTDPSAQQAICGQLSAYEYTLLIPAVAAPYINAELGPDPNYIWINVTWGLGAAILVSVGGRLSDIFGRRYFMLAGAFISFLGTIVGATGQSIGQMIASGVMFGIGSGFQEMGFACIMEFIPNKYRLTALGMLSAGEGCFRSFGRRQLSLTMLPG